MEEEDCQETEERPFVNADIDHPELKEEWNMAEARWRTREIYCPRCSNNRCWVTECPLNPFAIDARIENLGNGRVDLVNIFECHGEVRGWGCVIHKTGFGTDWEGYCDRMKK